MNDYSSSDNLFQEKSRKESYGVKKYKVKPREIKTRKKRTLKRKQRPLQTDTSSDGDSDVPLEELRKEIKYEGSKASVKGKAKRDDAEEPRLCPICGKLFKAKQVSCYGVLKNYKHRCYVAEFQFSHDYSA